MGAVGECWTTKKLQSEIKAIGQIVESVELSFPLQGNVVTKCLRSSTWSCSRWLSSTMSDMSLI